jgi:hypothetical protein
LQALALRSYLYPSIIVFQRWNNSPFLYVSLPF